MEEWREIPGYEGIYEASDEGRIRSCVGKTTITVRHGKRLWKQRVLKQKVVQNVKGRRDARVVLWKDGTEKTYLVARLIAFTWCAGWAEGLTVNHKDGNPLNNNAQNLEWITLAENIQKGFEDGLYPQKRVVLIDADQNEKSFRSMAEASRFLGYNPGYISTLLLRGREPCGYTVLCRG